MTTVGRSDLYGEEGEKDVGWRYEEEAQILQKLFSHLGFLPKPGLWPKDEKKIPFSCHTTRNEKRKKKDQERN